jgi:hypothetical protein
MTAGVGSRQLLAAPSYLNCTHPSLCTSNKMRTQGRQPEDKTKATIQVTTGRSWGPAGIMCVYSLRGPTLDMCMLYPIVSDLGYCSNIIFKAFTF